MTSPFLFNSHSPWVSISAIGLGSVLLWLGAALAELWRKPVQALPRRQSELVLAAAVLLLATGLWWPGQAMLQDTRFPATREARSAVAWLLALLPPILALGLAQVAKRCSNGVLALATGASGLLSALWVAVAHPGAFGAGDMAGLGGSLALGLLMSTLLTLLLVPRRWPLENRHLRPLAAMGAAFALAAVAAASVPPPGDWGFGNWAPSLMLATLAGLGFAWRATLRVAPPPPPEPPRQREPRADAAAQAPPMDSLTQLPTRQFFEQRLIRATIQCDAEKSRLALLFVDLDGFKPVNDTFGHSLGDQVLEMVGERLKKMAGTTNVVARIGGDEFLMLITGNPTVESVGDLATVLIENINRPYTVENREVLISCSVGVAFYPDNGAHGKLIARADAAMYAAKRAGGSCYAFYTSAMDADAREQFDLLRDLRKALELNQLELFYQPKIDATTAKVTAVEALLRWKHPTRGVVPPGIFIPVAERFGVIGALGNWVIEESCRQARVWRESGLRMRVAINLSALQMRQDDIVERIQGALARNSIHPSLFTCEITESVAMEDTKATQAAVRRLGEAGVHLSIDDFGTGYSSLAYLRKLPAEELKIDHSFVQDVERSADARSVVDAVVKLAHALGLRVVAEGVENERQQQILVEMGCDELQGYMFAKPMSASALLLWAMDDKHRAVSFSPSLFGETVPEEHL